MVLRNVTRLAVRRRAAVALGDHDVRAAVNGGWTGHHFETATCDSSVLKQEAEWIGACLTPRIMRSLGCILICCAALVSGLSATAEARGLVGPSVRVSLEGGREWGVGLRGDARGWRLTLGSTGGATSVVFIDETAPTHDKWVVEARGRSLVLESARFQGGHAYRVEIRRGSTVVDRGLVYLYPTRGARSARVQFDVDSVDLASAQDEDGIRVQPKSAL